MSYLPDRYSSAAFSADILASAPVFDCPAKSSELAIEVSLPFSVTDQTHQSSSIASACSVKSPLRAVQSSFRSPVQSNFMLLPVNNVDEVAEMVNSNGLPQILNHLTPLFGCGVNVVDKGKQVFAFGVHVFSQYPPVFQLLFPCSLTGFGSSTHCVSCDVRKCPTQRKNCGGFFPYGFAKESPLFFIQKLSRARTLARRCALNSGTGLTLMALEGAIWSEGGVFHPPSGTDRKLCASVYPSVRRSCQRQAFLHMSRSPYFPRIDCRRPDREAPIRISRPIDYTAGATL